jgi:anti-sigma factor RsiW
VSDTRLFRADDPVHRSAVELLPWHVNGTLAADERAQLEAHLAQCLRCQRELEALRELREAIIAAEAVRSAADYGLARTLARIEQLESPPPSRLRRVRGAWRRAGPWLRRLVAAQVALMLVVGVVLIAWQRAPTSYRTLGTASAPAPATGRLSLLVAAGASESELATALQRAGARVVAQQADRYVVEVPAARVGDALQVLRSSAAVRAAEPMP